MSLSDGSGYLIARATGRCTATGRELAVGERYVATLVEREGCEQFAREDFCVESWEAGARPAPPGRVFASWRAVVPEPNARKSTFLADDELLELFERLAEASEPRRVAFRYLLALVLIRRRVLRYEGTREGVMRVRARGGAGLPEPPPMTVLDPRMDEQTIAGAMEQLGEIMALDGPGQAPAKAPA